MNKDSSAQHSLSGKLIISILWNLFGQGWMLILAFFTTPIIVRSLSVNLYGVYALLGVILGYFSFLRIGLITASIKYISQYLAGKEEDKIRNIFWSCLLAYVFLGLLGTGIIAYCAQILVDRFFKIPDELKQIAIIALKIGSIGFLINMLLGAIGAVFQALGRFDILNRIQILLGTAQLVTAVILLKLGFSLKEIIISNLVIDSIGIYICWSRAIKLLPFLRKPSVDLESAKKLFKFAGPSTISEVIGSVLINIDKILLSWFRSISALTYYSIPFSLVDRLSMMRSSFSSAVFPSVSYFKGADRDNINEEIHHNSTIFLFYIYLFFILFFLAFGKSFLGLWLGDDFARESTKILIILSFAGLASALSASSFITLQGMGKPDIPARLRLIEIIIYIPATYIFIKKFGGVGAATAWFLRALLDAVLMHKAACDLLKINIFRWYYSLFTQVLVPSLLCIISFWLLRQMRLHLLSAINITGVILIAFLYAYSIWKWGFGAFAREKISGFVKSYLYR